MELSLVRRLPRFLALVLVMAIGLPIVARAATRDEIVLPPTEAAIAKLLPGGWVLKPEPKEAVASGLIIFETGGRFSYDAVFKLAKGGTVNVTASGRWRAEKGLLIAEVKESSRPEMIPPGATTVDVFLRLDDALLELRNEGGHIERFERNAG